MTVSNISIAMCTFNGGSFLESQLESIARQSLTPLELVICDDHSSDNTVEIVRDFSKQAGFPVRLVENLVNVGSTKNFEKAIGLCEGHIVALADQDDVWYPQKLKRIAEAFLGAGAIAVFSDADLIDDDGKDLGARLWSTFGFTRTEQEMLAHGGAFSILIKHPVVTGACMAFLRECFDRITPIPTDEIHDQWISFLLAAVGRVDMIPEPLLQYRKHRHQQVGPGPLGFEGRLSVAKSRGREFYLNEIVRFRRLSVKLGELEKNQASGGPRQKELDRKILHLEHRAHLPHHRTARLPKIVREALMGNYWRYSGGWISIAKDLILPL